MFLGLDTLNAQEVDPIQIIESSKNVVIGNGCDNPKVKAISKYDYDFKDNKVVLFNASWNIEQDLFNNGKPITTLEAMHQGLLVMLCPNDYVERVRQPKNLKL